MRADGLMPRHRYELVGYDQIAEYAQSKCQTSIIDATVEAGLVRIGLKGTSTVALRVYVCNDDDIGECRYEEVAAFSGGSWVEFRA